jgi:lipopolysaccharide transport system permease protein
MKEITEYRISPPNKTTLGLAELFRYRELFYFFTWRDIKVKYKQSLLGFAWAILQPLLLMVIFTVFFGTFLGVGDKVGTIPYALFNYSGLMFWGIFASGLNNAGNSMVSNSNIIKKIYFPRMIIPMSAILVAVFDFVIAFVVFLILAWSMSIYQGFTVNWIMIVILSPICVLLSIFATLGMGSLIASLNVKYRDFRYLIPFIIQVLFFLAPVIYPEDIVTEPLLKKVIALSPMYAPISLKNLMFDIPVDLTCMLISLASSLFFLIFGVYYFRKTEAYFADIA